jgi:hypothetical protein
MSGDIPHSPNTPSWRGVQLKKEAQRQVYTAILLYFTSSHVADNGTKSLDFTIRISFYLKNYFSCVSGVVLLDGPQDAHLCINCDSSRAYRGLSWAGSTGQ